MWTRKVNFMRNRLCFFGLLLLSLSSEAADNIYHLVIENHVFKPSVLEIPVNKKVKLIIHNKDKLAEEFDSFDLNREKVIFAGKKSTIYIGPLPKGEYEFFGEYHPVSAQGKIIVKELNDAN
ncbi:cupredoxin domain-containing protein [Thalassotalea piscium]